MATSAGASTNNKQMPPAGKFVSCTACNEGNTLIDQNQ